MSGEKLSGNGRRNGANSEQRSIFLGLRHDWPLIWPGARTVLGD
jgi:hypothetical protein